jgi:hypothetical protein
MADGLPAHEVLQVHEVITGAAAWLLAACRHVAGKRVQLDIVSGKRLRLTTDAQALTGEPERPNAGLDALITQRGWNFGDGRRDWPEVFEACTDWELAVPQAKGSLLIEGVGAAVQPRKVVDHREPGVRFTFSIDPSRTSGVLESPETLAALHAQAMKWPDVKMIVRLAGWDQLTHGIPVER